MDRQAELAIVRRAYAKQTLPAAGINDPRIQAAMPPSVRVWDAVYALHTGEIAGVPGRCLALLVGVSLSVLIGLGVSSYLLRTQPIEGPGEHLTEFPRRY
jgi:uncharacterized iron-regulated membrane protein